MRPDNLRVVSIAGQGGREAAGAVGLKYVQQALGQQGAQEAPHGQLAQARRAGSTRMLDSM